MLEYTRTDISEGVDTKKRDGLCECIIYYWYFFEVNSKFQSKVYNDCQDITQKFMSFNDFAIATIRENDYRINFWFTKNEAVDREENADLNKKSVCLWLQEKLL